ncbi:hypothetical protein AABC73_06815 [Pseudomonas sp. G.S.17]|uniref:hypothetical protein n=1 Tax=Pseudomonas sp. G.S.17 TaxID=3137451 RepID=UPI00311CCBAB
MQTSQRITVVLKPREGEEIGAVATFLSLGSTVMIGRGGAVVASLSAGDKISHAEILENQIVLAESAMRRGVVMQDQDHLPALRRVIGSIPSLYLAVSDEIKQKALDDGDDEDEAEEKAGQALRTLIIFKQKLESMLEPDLLTTQVTGSLITENPVVAETPYAQVRVTNIDAWLTTVKNSARYEWLRDKDRVEDMDTDLCAARNEQCYFDTELDTEIDNGMRLARLLEKHGEPV